MSPRTPCSRAGAYRDQRQWVSRTLVVAAYRLSTSRSERLEQSRFSTEWYIMARRWSSREFRRPGPSFNRDSVLIRPSPDGHTGFTRGPQQGDAKFVPRQPLLLVHLSRRSRSLRTHQPWKSRESPVPVAGHFPAQRSTWPGATASCDRDFRTNRGEFSARWRAGTAKGDEIERGGGFPNPRCLGSTFMRRRAYRRNGLALHGLSTRQYAAVLAVLTDHRFCDRTVSHTS
jgi:hypothetical protein